MGVPRFRSPVNAGGDCQKQPHIDVVIPAWNGADYVAHAMRAVLDIERDDLEFVISVDKSVDDTSIFSGWQWRQGAATDLGRCQIKIHRLNCSRVA